MTKLERKYVIDYIVDGSIKETINKNNPMAIVYTKWLISRLSKSSHSHGKLVRRCINSAEVIRYQNEQKQRTNARIINTGK